MSEAKAAPKTSPVTPEPLKNGDEPTALLRALAFEYLCDLERRQDVQFLEVVGADGGTVLLVVIPNAKVVGNKIETVGTGAK
jgi:hypothetical protein